MKSIFLLLFCLIPFSATSSPFHEEPAVFYNGDVKLSATFFIPDGKGKFPAIAVTHGSGREGKNDRGYRSLATQLVNAGYAVLIFDKRGVGNSDGEYIETPQLAVPAGDLLQAVQFLKSRKEVDAKRIGVYGHSQGGWVAPLAASLSPDVSFLIVSCGGGISVRDQVLYNSSVDLKRQGYKTEIVDSIVSFGKTLYTYLGSGQDYSATNELYKKAVTLPWFTFFKQMRFGAQLPPPSMLNEPVFTFFKNISYDPSDALSKVNVPTLVILAGKDETVPSAESKRIWEEIFAQNNRSEKLTIAWIPSESHYSFEMSGDQVVFKKNFAQPMLKWLAGLNVGQ